jgi:ferredoxin
MELYNKSKGYIQRRYGGGRRLRHFFQGGWVLLTNAHFAGFVTGKIYQGASKNLCLPGLNCYSCPGALGSCPIGSLQALIGSWKFNFTFYVTGLLLGLGTLCGRFICGWLCPFGLVQDLLYKIPFPLKRRSSPGDKPLRFLKYLVLAVLVVLMPLLIRNISGQGSPWFCKLLCPSGTLFAGWPLVAANESLRETLGWLFAWKNVLLFAILLGSVILYRPFCKYLCPLGALYGLLNRFSFYTLHVDGTKCMNCGSCKRVCGMDVDPCRKPNSMECIRCGDCRKACRVGALEFRMMGKPLGSGRAAKADPCALPPESSSSDTAGN